MAKNDPTITSERSESKSSSDSTDNSVTTQATENSAKVTRNPQPTAAGDPGLQEAPRVNDADHATVNQSHSDHPDKGSLLSEDQVVQVEDGTDPPKEWFNAAVAGN